MIPRTAKDLQKMGAFCRGCHGALPIEIDDYWHYVVKKESGQNVFSWVGPFCSMPCTSLWLKDLICQKCYKKISAHSARSVRAFTLPNGQRIGPFCHHRCATLWFRAKELASATSPRPPP